MKSGQYYLDGQDLWDTYGVMLERGSTGDLLALPNPKPTLAHEWEDEDGEDVLSTPVKVQARDVTVKCLIVAAGESDFWNKYNGFYDKMREGAVRWFVSEFNKPYDLLLKSFGKPTRYTRIKNTNKIIVRFDMTLRELNPALIIYNVLVDNLDMYPMDDNDYFLSM
ncbi:hypothetical protein AGMMS4956_18380 [Bacteroidia bacterium]|nr:hypothetical protein AGMMS4956_18380 [Bacteroidia bacterium]